MNLNWLYTAVSFIMLRWHDALTFLEDRTFLGTNWDWVLSIILLVITVRIILFPLFVKQIKSQRAMQALQPQLKALQEKHKGDRETLQKEMMELYKREKANPLMGCLPIFLQVPVFISLFWILGRRLDPNRAWNLGPNPTPEALETSHIELYGWTLEQYSSAAEAKLFNAPIAAVFYEVGWFERDMVSHYGEMGTTQLNVMLVAGILTLLMVFTTFLTSRQMVLKTGWATDPTQLMMQRLMVYGLPLMLLFSGAFFPISVIIYWVTNNLFSLGQQQWVLRKYPPPPSANANKDGAPAGKSGGGAGKGGKTAVKDAPAAPAVDGQKLAPKPGAKPVRSKSIPPRRPVGESIPPKPKKAGGTPAKQSGSAKQTGQSAPAKPAATSGTAPSESATSGSGKSGSNSSRSNKPASNKPASNKPGKKAAPGKSAGGAGAGKGGSGKGADQPGSRNGGKGTGGKTSGEPWPAPPPFEVGSSDTSDQARRRSG